MQLINIWYAAPKEVANQFGTHAVGPSMYLHYSMADPPSSPPFESGQFGILFQKVAQCSETCDKTILRYKRFCAQIIQKYREHDQRWKRLFVCFVQFVSSQKMCNVLKRMQNQISQFCDFYFLRYGRFCPQNS